MTSNRQRDGSVNNIFGHIIASSGSEPYRRIKEATIIAGRDRRSATPAQARNFLDAMRGLFRWARQANLVTVDPTVAVKNPRRKAGDGFIPWTEDHVAAYHKQWPLGTRQRVWL